MNLKFSQKNIGYLNLKQIGDLNRKIKSENKELFLAGAVRCNICGNSAPLDMYLEGFKICDCNKKGLKMLKANLQYERLLIKLTALRIYRRILEIYMEELDIREDVEKYVEEVKQ